MFLTNAIDINLKNSLIIAIPTQIIPKRRNGLNFDPLEQENAPLFSELKTFYF
jgi:hypothetical protein